MAPVKDLFETWNLYCQDESRFGLFTRNGRGLTAKGIKPICPFQQKFLNTYLYGAFSPITGDSFILDLPTCDTDNFQLFLDELSDFNPTEFKVVMLDNGSFHKAIRLSIPKNICLIFLPPYSPELNPAEKIWAILKKSIELKSFKTLEDLQTVLYEEIKKKLTQDRIKQTTGFDFLLSTFWTIMNI